MAIRYKLNTIFLLGIYFIISITSNFLTLLFREEKNLRKKKIWLKILSRLKLENKEVICYSFICHANMYVLPRMFGQLFSLIPFKGEQIVVDAIKNIPKNSIFIDAGANIGKYSLLASKNASKIIAVEPENGNFTLLKKNMILNQVQNVKLINSALASKKGSIRLYVSDDSSTPSLYLKNKSEEINSYEVKSVTLNQLLTENNVDQVDFLKMDIEGAEMEVLNHFSDSVGKIKKAIIEIHENKYFDDMKKIFENQNFKTRKSGQFIIVERKK